MESKNRSGAVKSKRSKRRFLTKSDNYINSNETNKIVDKHILKTRGPYVVRNPEKLNTDDNLDDGPKPKNRGAVKKEANQRKFSSTVITTSLLGNRKFITHEIVKTNRRNRNNINNKREQNDTKSIISDMKNNSRNFKTKTKSQSSYKKKNREDEVIYVLPSRNNNYQSVTTTISGISKQDNSSNLYQKEIHQTCSGIDRIADEVLEGWIKRKEKMKSSEHANITKDKPNEVYNLCVDFVETNSDPKIQEKNSTSKIEKTYIKTQKSITKNTPENIYDIDLTDHKNTPNKFYVIEEDENKPKPRFKKPKILVKHNLKTQSLINSKQSKSFKKHNYKDIKRSSKKEFINLIKKELQSSNIYEEPHNMFEVLKTLARRRNKDNHISFVDGIALKTKRNTECDYGNPKLINSLKKFVPKSKTLSFAKIPRTGIKNKMPSALEVKHFHKAPINRLQVITI